MTLQERILVAGVPGVGKTYSWLTIARALPKSKFYVIDPDDGVRRVWYNEFPDVKNVEYTSPRNGIRTGQSMCPKYSSYQTQVAIPVELLMPGKQSSLRLNQMTGLSLSI